MEIMETKNEQNKKKLLYNCEKCDYHSNKIYHYKNNYEDIKR